MARTTNNSVSTNSHPNHKRRNLKRRKYTTSPAGKNIKAEPKDEQIETAKLLHSLSPPEDLGWENPAELDYVDAKTWTKDEIVQHLITNSFSVPCRIPRSKWATITLADGSTTVVPNAYRIPLMFVGEFMWSSLRLVLGDEGEWEEFKTGILHVSRLCEAFLREAKRAMGEEGMAIGWRCTTFDRVLVRYRMGWLLCEPGYLKEFWEMYGEEEYRKDAIRFDWKRLVLKGQKGFKLSEERIDNGITASQWMNGLKKEVSGDWIWDSTPRTSCFQEATKYLEAWQRTKVWGQPPGLCISTDSPTNDLELSLKHTTTDSDPSHERRCSIAPLDNVHNEVSALLPFPSPLPKTDLLQILYLKYQSQELRISSLEKDISMLKQAKGFTAAAFVPETFVPAPNFPELSDPDCSTSFWREPLETLLYTDTCGEEGGIAKSELEVGEVRFESKSVLPEMVDLGALLEDTASAPIKSLRKLRRP
ncbi:uncharacterized protein EV420DRAFT_1749962 [Desarmillaria tabescens]|uniref:Uncharacterized protein n=1 Tax=Armillaria tabescens TaxID=1929756 RepID=A0AA39K0Q5_ARMTA|nr:uncharacterized protein EV420DRAFT_1749962 [Desarmillaria tabescens]KAK0452157.1 hypothetical protein EV420DRAFT_1749962 [Desarmillaria tabescens]